MSAFCETQGKHSPSGARRDTLVVLTLAGDKWEVGGGVMSRGWDGCGAERAPSADRAGGQWRRDRHCRCRYYGAVLTLEI